LPPDRPAILPSLCRSLFAKLRSLLSPSEACDEAVEGSSVVPSKRSLSGYGLHKDHLPDGSLVDGMVGVVYLEGQGTMVFTHDHTGTVRTLEFSITQRPRQRAYPSCYPVLLLLLLQLHLMKLVVCLVLHRSTRWTCSLVG
jgi:hypothetical protein